MRPQRAAIALTDQWLSAGSSRSCRHRSRLFEGQDATVGGWIRARRLQGNALTVFDSFRDHDWIGNSRYRADEDVIRLLASMAGFQPRLTHQSDNLDVLEDLILAGLGVGLLPTDRPTRPGITILPLTEPDVRLRAHAHARRGRTAWPPLALVLARLTATPRRRRHR